MDNRLDRREFLAGVAGAAILLPSTRMPALRFSVAGVSHPHINAMTAAMWVGVWWYEPRSVTSS